MQNLFDELKDLLQQDERLVIDGKLLKNKIIELGLQLDSSLIKKLLSNPSIKKHFFQTVDGVLVFDKIKFQKFISNKAFLPNSYTSFKNRIGLTSDDEYISESKDVVLSWPYKDCVLQGDQTNEDVKRKELFWNELLAPDQIDRLFLPKVLTNFKKYDENASHKVNELSFRDNLLIKGNNLLALHSLKKVYAGEVKLIYIDPPYNTGDDSFKYNDSFNHSTWLTFMRNRLEVAKELLSNDGIILVQIDNSPSSFEEAPEFGYLLVLMDEVFQRSNYLTTLVWKKKGNPSNTEKRIGTITESILMYAKNIHQVNPNLQEYKRAYSYEENGIPYNLEFPVKTNEGGYERTTMQFGIETEEGVFYPPPGKRWTIGEKKIKEIVKNEQYVIEDGKFKVKKFSEDYIRGEFKLYSNLLLDHGSLNSAKNELKALGFNREDFGSPKPEILMHTLISICTNQEDIVMDFFAGSGTTLAIALKMGRQFIGIEQMDYIENITIERLKKVIAGEQGGISKFVSWSGGGSFNYCELAKANQIFVEQIESATMPEQLKTNWIRMKESAFLDYKMEPGQLDNNSKDFEDLNLIDQKKLLIDMLDKNMLYVNYCDIDDKDFNVSSSDKTLNHQFYKL